ncbi:ATP-dependent RNA helicase RhlE [Rhizobium sp. RU20A]|nr:ATP-dependent RNA helicase RhlE [Rhizobium sp. RU20A]
MTTFSDLGLSPQLLSMLATAGYETPTPIQEKAIPIVLEGRDVIGLAQTGTGKTAAFGLPMIQNLTAENRRADPRNVRALVLAPTRELVNQIAANLKTFVAKSPIRITTVVGGVSINRQIETLARGTDILVATPGRLLDLINRKAVTLTTARFLVLDEADQMLDLGFIHDLRKISKLVPKKRQTLLFSATMPKAIAELAGDYLTDPLRVEVTPPGKAADKVEQYVHFVAGKEQKTDILRKTLADNPDGRSIVFSRTKHGAEKLSKHLETIGFKVASIHGNKSQGQRERALAGFKDGTIKVLVATDVAARGIDIPAVTHVFNYDLPEVPDAYVHRIGRTARAGRDGIAIAFCAPDEVRLLRDIEKLMKIEIAVASGEPPVRTQGAPAGQQPKRKQSQHRKGQGPAAQAAHENAQAKRNRRNNRPARPSGGQNNGGNAGQNAGGQNRGNGQRRRETA